MVIMIMIMIMIIDSHIKRQNSAVRGRRLLRSIMKSHIIALDSIPLI
jgi:hypothetical protein